MARATTARKRTVTPGWAWAVAGLCVLLLAPLISQRDKLLPRATPLEAASGSAAPAPSRFAHVRSHGKTAAGHNRSTTNLNVAGKALPWVGAATTSYLVECKRELQHKAKLLLRKNKRLFEAISAL